MTVRPITSFALLVLVLAVGCAGPLNREMEVGGVWTPPTLMDNTALAARADAEDPDPSEPSAPTLDRSHWPTTTIAVPNDLTAHQPLYTRSVFDAAHTDSPTRATGKYPTALSSLDVPGSVRGNAAQAEEAIVAPFAGAFDIILWLPRAVVTRPWQTTRMGLEPYQRAPHTQVLMPLALEPTEEPPRAPMPPAEPIYPETGSPGNAPWTPPAPVVPPPPQPEPSPKP